MLHLVTVLGGWEEVASRAEVLRARPIGGEGTLSVSR
jgi:hypothetical protein